LSQRGLPDKMRWYAYGMPAPFPDELAAAMVNAGCDGMNFGADSADARMLQVIRRTFTPADIAAAIDTCRRHGLPNMVELLIGFPGETPDSVRSSIEFLRAANPSLVMVSVGIRVFPGTELAAMIQAEAATTGLSRQLVPGDNLRQPVFYVSPALGPDPVGLVCDVIGGDPRFFPPNGSETNYNANHVLVEAIRGGARGAYWRILAERTTAMADTR
jgi:hypothetical protein